MSLSKKLISVLAIILPAFMFLAGSVYALPPKPPIGGQPGLPGNPPNPPDPAFPPQPQLPPCPECGEFFGTPTPTPGAVVQPTPTPSGTEAPSSSQPSSGGGGGGSSSAGGAGGGGVLGLSTTSGENDILLSVLSAIGILCAFSGLRLIGRKSLVRVN